MVELNRQIVMDSKGRILIPLEIRKQLNFKPGENFMFTIENGRLILLKSSDHDEFIQEIETFQQELQKLSKNPIPTKKLF